MVKKLTAFRIEEQVHRELRILAAKHGRPIGEVLLGLVNLAKMMQEAKSYINDPNILELLAGIYETAMGDIGEDSEWTTPAEIMQKFKDEGFEPEK